MGYTVDEQMGLFDEPFDDVKQVLNFMVEVTNNSIEPDMNKSDIRDMEDKIYNFLWFDGVFPVDEIVEFYQNTYNNEPFKDVERYFTELYK